MKPEIAQPGVPGAVISDDPESTFRKALELSQPSSRTAPPAYAKTRTKKITRRGIMWIGQTCNLRCRFCYFMDRIRAADHPEHPFMTVEKAKQICSVLVDVYNNNSIDIQGGEPTLWEGIFELVNHCEEIGLAPTIITNAILLDDKATVLRYKEAGIRDFIVSVHGLGEVHDWITGFPGAHARQMKALRNLQEAGIPFRFNCVLTKAILPQLPLIADLGVRLGAQVVNFLAFNPFDDQKIAGKRSTENVPTYTEVSDPLNRALDVLSAKGVEGNARYLPLCVVDERHRSSAYTFRQLSWDVHENDFASWHWTGLQPQRIREGELSAPPGFGPRFRLGRTRHFLRKMGRTSLLGPLMTRSKQHLDYLWPVLCGPFSRLSRDEAYFREAKVRSREHCDYQYGEACSGCDIREICDGFHGDYAEFFGTGEARPVRIGKLVEDPRFFINQQEKNLHPDDLAWIDPGNQARKGIR